MKYLIECIDENGCIGVPEGIGIGAEYDWDYISKNQIDHKVFS